METLFTSAEEFIWRNARLLDRQLFAFQFNGGSADAVVAAMRAYQNADGGFGNALEPDIRCPDSQPVPTQHALEYLDWIGHFDGPLTERVCDFLETITTTEGGVPFVLPSVRAYPRAPWWETADQPLASLNPTAMIAGILHKWRFQHQWLDRATAFCWPNIEALQPHDEHALLCAIGFLRHVPAWEQAEVQIERLGAALLESGMVADAGTAGYVRDALDWAPTPDHPFRHLFSPEQIAACLDVRIARQQEDGGWPISWPPPSPAAESEWRGWVTVQTLMTLRANGRI
jgi:hypothetical protein